VRFLPAQDATRSQADVAAAFVADPPCACACAALPAPLAVPVAGGAGWRCTWATAGASSRVPRRAAARRLPTRALRAVPSNVRLAKGEAAVMTNPHTLESHPEGATNGSATQRTSTAQQRSSRRATAGWRPATHITRWRGTSRTAASPAPTAPHITPPLVPRAENVCRLWRATVSRRGEPLERRAERRRLTRRNSVEKARCTAVGCLDVLRLLLGGPKRELHRGRFWPTHHRHRMICVCGCLKSSRHYFAPACRR
jgi:hypothetical protein